MIMIHCCFLKSMPNFGLYWKTHSMSLDLKKDCARKIPFRFTKPKKYDALLFGMSSLS